jgi:hypothetical protein
MVGQAGRRVEGRGEDFLALGDHQVRGCGTTSEQLSFQEWIWLYPPECGQTVPYSNLCH